MSYSVMKLRPCDNAWPLARLRSCVMALLRNPLSLQEHMHSLGLVMTDHLSPMLALLSEMRQENC